MSVPRCSKGAQGLSVPLRVIGVFTDTTISPSSRSRQCSDRCTIRAGRNLPDKEFRYLRTVIVTAAVYWGFSCELHAQRALTRSIDLPAPGRCQPLYVVLRLSRGLCFVKQSSEPVHCDPFPLLDGKGRPFFRSYGARLLNSLTTIHSSAWGYSPRLPVSVYDTGSFSDAWRFSWWHAWGLYEFACRLPLLSRFSLWNGAADLPTAPAYLLQRAFVSTRPLRYHVTSDVNAVGRYGNIDPFSIAYALRPQLRSRLTLFRLALNRNS